MPKRKRPEPSVDAKKTPGLPPGFSTSNATNMDEVTASLAAIYGKRPGTAVRADLAKMDVVKHQTWLAVLFASVVLIVLLTVAAWAGFWWWSGLAKGAGLQVAVEGPQRVAIGQEVTYFINWFNRSSEPLTSAQVRVAFPDDFAVDGIEPQPTTHAEDSSPSFTSDLGSIAANAHGTIKVTGIFTGALGTKSTIQVIGTFHETSANGEEQTLVAQDLEYADSVLNGSLELPVKVLPGDHVAIVYHVINKGDAPMDGLLARLTLPDGFARDVATGTAAQIVNGNVLQLPVGLIAPGTSSTIRVTGTFALGARGDVSVHAEAGRLASDQSFAAAQKTDGTLSVLPGNISLNLSMNGSGQDRSVGLGERQHVALTYTNTSGEELQNVILRFRLDAATPSTTAAALVDWKGLEDSTSGTRSGNVLTYTSEQIGQLERLPPDGSGMIELSVPLATVATSGQDVPLLASAEAVIGAVGGTVVHRNVSTQPVGLHLQTDAALTSIARFASEEGAPVGHGPLPPVAGTSTTYRIEWTVDKTIHALNRVTVSATLPKAVTFVSTKQVDAGTVAYDPDKRLVTWIADKIADTANETTVSFDVAVTPSQADIGRFADLLGESRFEFTDAKINESLLRTAPSLSTDLPNDDLAKNKGVVRKP
jgi:hypothetical protein